MFPGDGLDVDHAHEQAVVNGVRLHYVRAGDPAAPPVVLLHGFPEFWYAWRKQIPELVAAGFQVVAPDMRGYNRSEKPRGVGSYRLATLARDVVDLIHHLGADSAPVVGHDWGGLVAYEVAARYPVVVDRLVVLNAPHLAAYRDELQGSADQWRRSAYVLLFQLPGIEGLLPLGDHRWLRATLRNDPVDPDAFSHVDIERYVRAIDRPGALTSALAYYRSLFRQTVRDRVPLLRADPGGGRVDVPTLLIWGQRDAALGPGIPDRCHDYVTDLTVERIPEASHWVQADAPERVNDLLVDVL